MYYAWLIHAHLRCTQCSILLHIMDICFLTCICLEQISQIQTRLCDVVGPGLVSTSPAFVRSSASHPVGPHGRLAPKNGESGPRCTAVCDRCDSSTACRLCRLEPSTSLITSCSWQTQSTLIRLHMKTTTIPGLHRTYDNLKKANWDRYRQEVEATLSKRSLPTDCQRKK